MKIEKKLVLKKDLVITKGTEFFEEFGRYEAVIGTGKDTCIYVVCTDAYEEIMYGEGYFKRIISAKCFKSDKLKFEECVGEYTQKGTLKKKCKECDLRLCD